MLDPTARTALDRIEAALARIEAVARGPARPQTHADGNGDSRYESLRQRTQAALESLESVIAQVDSGGGRR